MKHNLAAIFATGLVAAAGLVMGDCGDVAEKAV